MGPSTQIRSHLTLIYCKQKTGVIGIDVQQKPKTTTTRCCSGKWLANGWYGDRKRNLPGLTNFGFQCMQIARQNCKCKQHESILPSVSFTSWWWRHNGDMFSCIHTLFVHHSVLKYWTEQLCPFRANVSFQINAINISLRYQVRDGNIW